MKMTIRLVLSGGLVITSTLLLMCILNSCSTFEPPIPPTLTVVTNPSSGHPPFTTIVTAVCSQPGGTFALTVEGENPVGSTEGLFTALIEDWPWRATVSWTDGKGTVLEETVKVTLVNERPVAHALWTEPTHYRDRSLILIDLQYLLHGCASSGAPTLATGFEDPDHTQDGYSTENDGFTYHVEVQDMTTGEFESVFYGPNRTLMDDEFVDNPIFYWFVNHSGEEPIYQYLVWSPTELSPMVCSPRPSSLRDNGVFTIKKRIHIYIREFSESYHWVYSVFTMSPWCLP